MKIGSVEINNRTVLAPLAGITNLPFRLLSKEWGCGLVCSEMISSNGIVYKSSKTERLFESCPEEKPFSAQIFGSDPFIMADSASIVESSGVDILDINFGCSVKKILKSGSGPALMREPQKYTEILKAVRESIDIPLTIKIRSGWDKSGAQALDLARTAEDCGVDAITIHPRTATQGFSGHADWSLIGKIKKIVAIPVIGNGDINTPQDALKMLDETNCDAVMIGRASIGKPWIFSQVNALLSGGDVTEPNLTECFENMIRYLEDSVKYLGENQACNIMRSRLGWFVKGMPFSSHFRESIKSISSENQAKELVAEYRDLIKNRMDRKDSVPYSNE